jgi:hypothetical protein
MICVLENIGLASEVRRPRRARRDNQLSQPEMH